MHTSASRKKDGSIRRFMKSLRVRIFLVCFLIGLLSTFVMKYAILANYETRVTDAFEDISVDVAKETLALLKTKADRIQMIVILVVLFVSVVIAALVSRPFDRVTKAIGEVRAGFTDEPFFVPGYLETEQISEAFHQMQARAKALDDSRQEFVSNVSHELKTPITSMKVLADTLLAQPDAPVEMYRDFLHDISDEIMREDQIINDLLALVRLDKATMPLNITQVNVGDMTEIILKRVRPIARQRNIELTLESEREVRAELDEVKFSLAVMNLVENAVKYNHDGGWVKAELDADHQDFTLKISDSGIGIAVEELDHIFERFYRVDKSRSTQIGGTGLGLSVVREAVIMHRGEIDVQSTEGVGTIFTIRMPLHHVAPMPEAEQLRRSGWFSRKRS